MNLGSLTYLSSQLLQAVFTWLTLSVLAKLYTPVIVGEYSFLLACITPVFLFFSMQIRNHYLSEDNASISEYSSIRLASLLPITTIIIILSYFLDFSHMVFGLALLKISDLIFELPFSYDQKKENLSKASFINILRLTSTYICLYIFLYRESSINLAFIYAAAVSLVFSSLYGLRISVFNLRKINFTLLKNIFPLGVAASVLALSLSLPKIYLERIGSIEDVAIFSVVFTFYSLWQLVFNNYFNGILHRINTVSIKIKLLFPLGIFLIAAVLFYYLDETIYVTFFGEAFIRCSEYTILLLISILISLFSSFFYYSFLGKKEFSIHLKLNSFTLLIHLILGYLMITYLGVKGAMLAWIFIQVIQTCTYWFRYAK